MASSPRTGLAYGERNAVRFYSSRQLERFKAASPCSGQEHGREISNQQYAPMESEAEPEALPPDAAADVAAAMTLE